MTKTLPLDTPNLVAAAARLRRTMRVWAVLMGAAGAITFAVNSAGHRVLALPWLAAAATLGFGQQPAYLALVAMVWGLSLIHFVPGVAGVFGIDPMVPAAGSSVATVGLILVRVVLLVTAWNQFLLYRLLYGTETATGLDPKLPHIPEVVPNQTDLLALTSRAVGAVGLIAGLAATAGGAASSTMLGLGMSLSVVGLGLGVGAAFSPTRQRGAALFGVGLSALAFLTSLIVGRWLAQTP
jgi:hypothetical protein